MHPLHHVCKNMTKSHLDWIAVGVFLSRTMTEHFHVRFCNFECLMRQKKNKNKKAQIKPEWLRILKKSWIYLN